MAIKKTKNGTYHLKIYIPSDVQGKLGFGQYYEKRFKTKREAKEHELQINTDIQRAKLGLSINNHTAKGDTLFKDFYKNNWLESYKAGQTTNTTKPPTVATVFQTENIFRLHILPLIGNYSLDFLNNNKQFLLSILTSKSNEYANFKALRGYINSVFDWAEEFEYIPANKIKKTITRIKSSKKIQLREAKRDENLTLNKQELQEWLKAVDQDYKDNFLSLMDYTLFYTTFFLSDRKSESYALQWKHIDLKNNLIKIEQALDRFGNIKSTKGNKKTIFNAPNELIELLKLWKSEQKKILKQLNIKQNSSQFLFTYNDNKNNINKCLHIDYLNYRMKTIRKRHPELAPASPHKLRHTGATLAKISGVSLATISEALTHSDTTITKEYVNTLDKVEMPAGEIAFRNLKND